MQKKYISLYKLKSKTIDIQVLDNLYGDEIPSLPFTLCASVADGTLEAVTFLIEAA